MRFPQLLPHGAALLLLCGPAFLQADTPAADPLRTLNQAARTSYARARADMLARSGPIIWVDGGHLVLLRGKKRSETEAVPALYEHLKAVSHAPLGLAVILAGAEDGLLSEERLTELHRFRELLVAARGALDKRGFSTAQQERQEKILTECLTQVDELLKSRQSKQSELTALCRKLGPLLSANNADAVRAQIDGLHAQVSAWRRQLSPEEWRQLRVVISGSQMPRKGNAAVQYFARLLGEPGEGRRIIYAEGLFEEERALRLLGTHLLDREIGIIFFDDPT